MTQLPGGEVASGAGEFFRRCLEPGFNQLGGGHQPDITKAGNLVAFTGVEANDVSGLPRTVVAVFDRSTGELSVVTPMPGNHSHPRWAPDGERLAYLSDRRRPGHNAAYLLERGRLGEATCLVEVAGTIEFLDWSPDGSRLLLGVAGPGADVAGPQGSGTTADTEADTASWLPLVDGGIDANHWRFLLVHDLRDGRTTRLPTELNVWEATWAGADRVWAIVSDQPDEDAWYDARAVLIDVVDGAESVTVTGEWQLGLPAATADGSRLSVVEAVASDRGLLAGRVLAVDAGSGSVEPLDVGALDVTCVQWTDNEHVVYLGARSLEMVVGHANVVDGKSTELWSGQASAGVKWPEGRASSTGEVALILQHWDQPPTVTIADQSGLHSLTTLTHPGHLFARTAAAATWRAVSWTASDGLRIDGLIATPAGAGPFPTILQVHGGPVFAWSDRWAMGSLLNQLLLARGYALLFPNPRGSGGRGPDFARAVVGDMGGADTGDYLAGIDSLVADGVADPARLTVMGISYGGFISAWLPTQDDRFAAAISISPVTNWRSMHYTCNIPEFCARFLGEGPHDLHGRYLQRSPITFASRVGTPMLMVAGARDRCTPPSQAQEFAAAVAATGTATKFVLYPNEGHGVRAIEAQIDLADRILAWLDRPPRDVQLPAAAADVHG